MDLIQRIKEIDSFKEVPDHELQWLVDNGELLEFEVGSHIFQPGDPIDQLIIILEGQAVIKAQQGNQFRVLGNFDRNDITGFLPYSRADKAFGSALVTVTATIFVLHKSRFREMIANQEVLTTTLVHFMSTRIREFTKSQQLNDKLMSLGKLSAGLAHELNNPSAAIVRSAQSLSKHMKQVPNNFKQVIKIEMTDEQVDQVNQILYNKLDSGRQQLGMMDRAEKEDDIVDWLDEEGIEDSEKLAENLVEFGFENDDLDKLKNNASAIDLVRALQWIDQILTTERLLEEIEDASQRINNLVSSIKSYTHMDQAPEKAATDLHIGLENTLTMLNHKINKLGIKVIRAFQSDLPKPNILASEMNQVWTNLIDNAIDAMEDANTRELSIKTFKDGDFINVIIGDSGSGIPDDIQSKIFDPFFTTKQIGKGTGLGMEVVYGIIKNQHNGAVTFVSKPGKTEFKVCLPIESN